MRYVMVLLVGLIIGGCSGLNVQWAASATYNTPAVTTTTMNPGKVEEPVKK